jgi:hypothetical protein
VDVRQATGALDLGGPREALGDRLVAGEQEVAVLMKRTGRAERLLDRLPEREPALGELDLERVGELLAHAAERAAGGARAVHVRLDQQDLVQAGARQVVCRRAAHDAASDHHCIHLRSHESSDRSNDESV